eukprot:365661-Chlamydomonas_euryale.AAC.45
MQRGHPGIATGVYGPICRYRSAAWHPWRNCRQHLAEYDARPLCVQVEEATKRGIPVGNTPGVLTETTAELAAALTLAAARRVAEADVFMRAGKYKVGARQLQASHTCCAASRARCADVGATLAWHAGQAWEVARSEELLPLLVCRHPLTGRVCRLPCYPVLRGATPSAFGAP